MGGHRPSLHANRPSSNSLSPNETICRFNRASAPIRSARIPRHIKPICEFEKFTDSQAAVPVSCSQAGARSPGKADAKASCRCESG